MFPVIIDFNSFSDWGRGHWGLKYMDDNVVKMNHVGSFAKTWLILKQFSAQKSKH